MIKKDISVIIPFLNEEENIASLVDAINGFTLNFQPTLEVVFVDDGSTDKSVNLLAEVDKKFATKIIKLSKNFGSHAALRAGVCNATGDYITFLYADLQDPIELIKDFYEEAKKGNDIVWGERKSTNNSGGETFFSRTYAFLMRKYVVTNYPRNGFDIAFFSSKVAKQLNQNIEANSSIFLQLLTLGYKQVTLSYNKKERVGGVSKWTLKKKIKLFVDSFVAFSYMPIKTVTMVGVILFVLGVLWSIYLVVRTLVWDDLNPGWPALMSVILIGFGVTNISLGIVAEYLWRTLDASRNRPVFIIDEIIE